jgi:transcriptional regulator with PAS, ATPase and Fis domain
MMDPDLLKTMADTAGVGLWIINSSRKVEYLNNWYSRLLPFNPQDAVGEPLNEVLQAIITPSSLQAFKTSIDMGFRGTTGSADWQVLKTDELGVIRNYYNPIVKGSQIQAVGGWSFDLTKEQALLRQLKDLGFAGSASAGVSACGS